MRLAALVLAFLFLLTGCAAKTAPQTPPEPTVGAALTPELSPAPVFTNGGTHRSTKDYSQVFTFLTTSNEACTLNIETRIFDAARATRLWETVTNDLKTIAANVPMRQDMPEIYVVEKPLHGIERIGYCLYCAAEDVENGAYREALVCAAFNFDPLASWWKTKGLVDYAFGETADEAFLRTYYEQADDKKLQVTYRLSSAHSWADSYASLVSLRHSSHALHETVHVMVPRKGEEAWKYEAIAQYFTNTFYPPMAERKMAFKAITELADTKVAADTDPFMEWVLRGNAIYLEHAKMPEKIEDMDHALYVKSRIEAYLRYPREGTRYPSVVENYLSVVSAHIAAVGGNELSYEEAYLFSDYLIEKNSLSTFLGYCLEGTSFLVAFGTTYEEAKTEWLAGVLAG